MVAARRARLSTEARRQQLVALGVEMFSERPFDDVSIDDIAVSAGISKGLLYHYFPSKRDFYVAVVRHSADEMEAITETDPQLAPLERLSVGLDRYLDYVDTHARGYATVLRAGIGSDPEWPRSSSEYARRWPDGFSTTWAARTPSRRASVLPSAGGWASPRRPSSNGSSTAT
jgi:AcrR family transcriptional regulator